MPIRIVIADDHPLLLNALEQLFAQEPDFEVVARCVNGTEALEAVRRLAPDVLLLDMRMPELSGLEVLEQMHGEHLATRTVLLTAEATDDEIAESLLLGVSGVVLKEMSPTLLVRCIRKVSGGEQWIEKQVASRALDRMLRKAGGEHDFRLSAREEEIVSMVAAGLHNREIGEKLLISGETVKSHLRNVYEKLGIATRTELLHYVRQHHLL